MSLTLPIVDNLDPTVVLGYMTIVAAASSLIAVTQSREGLGNTGIVLLVGPNRRENVFKYANRPATATYLPDPNSLKDSTVKVGLFNFPFLIQAVSGVARAPFSQLTPS